MITKDTLEGNGRENFSVRIKPEVMEEFKKMCGRHGFSIGRRIEIAMLNDINHIDSLDVANPERQPTGNCGTVIPHGDGSQCSPEPEGSNSPKPKKSMLDRATTVNSVNYKVTKRLHWKPLVMCP